MIYDRIRRQQDHKDMDRKDIHVNELWTSRASLGYARVSLDNDPRPNEGEGEGECKLQGLRLSEP